MKYSTHEHEHEQHFKVQSKLVTIRVASKMKD